MNAEEYLLAARVPSSVPSCEFGLWEIHRQYVDTPDEWMPMTTLYHMTMATMMGKGEVVMEDSKRELRRHLPIWMAAHGRVLVTGLGLGCVVRGLLANPDVDFIDVVEIDSEIIRVIGIEFYGNPRVHITHDDATKTKWEPWKEWDFAWHDLWIDAEGALPLARAHLKVIFDLMPNVERQGAWAMPREAKRKIPGIIG